MPDGPSATPDPAPNEEMWRAMLLGTDPRYARTRAWLKHIPSEPFVVTVGLPVPARP